MTDSVGLASIVLSALGAGGVLAPGVRRAHAFALERRRRRETREAPPEFFYRRCVVALRVVDPDRRYVHRREAQLIARKHGLTRVPWGHRPYGDVVAVDERLTLDTAALTASLVDPDANVDQSDGWRRRYVQFGRPLRRGEEVRFVHLQTFEVVGKPLEHVLRWSPITRCDEVVLQVAFASNPPRSVRYACYSSTGEELEWANLELDEITGAFTVRIDNPIPGRYYKVRW
jgi:hypothetical protein